MAAASRKEDWLPAAKPFGAMLALALDPRPKVRKKAQGAVAAILAGFAAAGSPNLAPASALVLRLSERVLPEPAAVVQALVGKKKAARRAAATQEALQRATTEALHLLRALKLWVGAPGGQLLPAGGTGAGLAGLLLDLLPLEQPLIARHAVDVLFAAITAGSPDDDGGVLDAAQAGRVLEGVLAALEGWDPRDADTVNAFLRLAEGAVLRLRRLDPDLGWRSLPRVAQAVVPLLATESESVRFAAAASLKRLVHSGVTPDRVAAALEQRGGGGPGRSPLESLVAALESTTGLRYQAAWDQTMPLLQVLLAALGPEGAPLARGVLDKLCGLAGAATEFPQLPLVEDCLGAAIAAWGPGRVLELAPLELGESLDGTAAGRAWLLPLLRKHTSGSTLAFFGTVLLPEARRMGARAAQALQQGRAQEHAICATLEGQCWAVFPAVCDWPSDTAASFKGIAKEVGAALQHRAELRSFICHGLCKLVAQNRQVALAATAADGGEEDGAGAGSDSEEEEGGAGAGLGAAGEAPEGFTPEAAEANLAAVGKFSKNFLPLLFNLFVAAPTDAKGDLQRTISAFALVSDQAALNGFFRNVLKRLAGAVKEGDEAGPAAAPELLAQRNALMDLCTALVAGLDGASLGLAARVAKAFLADGDTTIQKKAYKVFAEIFERHPAYLREHVAEFQAMLGETHDSCTSASRRYRLRCIKATVATMGGAGFRDEDVAERHAQQAAMITELCLCTKEVNHKTRVAAFKLLSELGRTYRPVQPGAPAGPRGFVAVVAAGLVAVHPHIISAAVMALAR